MAISTLLAFAHLRTCATQSTSYPKSWSLSSSHDKITATQSWPAFLSTCHGVCSRSWTPPRGWSSAFDAQTMCPTRWSAYIGCAFRSASSLKWPYLRTRSSMVARHRTLVRVADLPSRRALRSANTSRLIQPQSNQSTVGDRAFPVAGP